MIYGLHSLCIKKVLNNWATQNCIIPKDCRELMSDILESDPQLQWLTWQKDEASVMEQQNPDRGINIVKDQLLGENEYAEFQMQILCDDVSLEQCHILGLNAQKKDELQ